MKVITEESIRIKLRKKEFADGDCLTFPVDSLVTPSARSFLREHLISWTKAEAVDDKKGSAEQLSGTTDSCYTLRKAHLERFDLGNELLKLRNLFYFPMLSNDQLSSADWLYFEQQQRWLMSFRAAVFEENQELAGASVQTGVVNPEKVNLRIWTYCCSEICFQIERLLNLLCDYDLQLPPFAIEQFYEWSHRVLKSLKAEGLQQEVRE